MTIPYIHNIRNSNANVPNVVIPNWAVRQPTVDHLTPPVVLNIGNPIINSHRDCFLPFFLYMCILHLSQFESKLKDDYR